VPRTAGPEEPFRSLVPDPLERVALSQLHAAALRGLTPKAPEVIDTYHVAPIRASVKDAAQALLLALPGTEPTSFRALVRGIEHKLEVIVRFLAVLELYKQGVVDLLQFTNFGDLVVRRLSAGEVVLDVDSLDDWNEESVAAHDVGARS
jgi:segregation and condensation protein A